MSAPGWLSGHLFLRGGLHDHPADSIVVDVIAPFARRMMEEGAAHRWFFIRYGERGPHLRLRLLADDPSTDGPLAAALVRHVAAVFPGELRGVPAGEGEGVPIPSGDPSLLWVAYEPEVERYGGPEGVRLAEAFFHCSSEAAPLLLGGVTGDRDARLGRAMLTMMLLLGSFTRDPAVAVTVAEAHRDNFGGHPAGDPRVLELWKRFEDGFARQDEVLGERVLALWEALDDRPGLPPPLDAYLDGVLALRDGLREVLAQGLLCPGGGPAVRDWAWAVRALAPSYMHMTNNRLGVTPVEEAYLAYLISRTLSPLRGY